MGALGEGAKGTELNIRVITQNTSEGSIHKSIQSCQNEKRFVKITCCQFLIHFLAVSLALALW